MKIKLRKANLEDFEVIYTVFQRILEHGDTYSYTPEEMTPDRAMAYWISAPGTHCYIAEVGKDIAGFYAIRPNRTGRAGHVANGSFIVNPEYRKQGIGRKLGEHAIKTAKKLKYKAMQFNFVVSTNKVAVELWKSLGFNVIGAMPKALQHKSKGLVDVFIMHRFL